MVEPATRRMTLEEFLYWDDGTDTRYELWGGVVTAMAPPMPRHGRLAAAVTGELPRRAPVAPALRSIQRSRDRAARSQRYVLRRRYRRDLRTAAGGGPVDPQSRPDCRGTVTEYRGNRPADQDPRLPPHFERRGNPADRFRKRVRRSAPPRRRSLDQ
ncbi:MAG: Uma2 family endonuclease [Alphaproteobacteria bacterium]|nr:Uma2 family endonuclease [Alphaproteobacteria bacterium]